MILVIAEQRAGKLNRATWETIVGAQQLASWISVEAVDVGDVAQMNHTPGDAKTVTCAFAKLPAASVETVSNGSFESWTPLGLVPESNQTVTGLFGSNPLPLTVRF